MKTKTNGLYYFLVAIICFFALGYDLLQMFIDKLLFTNAVAENFFNSPWYVLVVHWLCVVLVWITAIILISKWIKKRSGSDVLKLKQNKSLKYFIPAAIILSIGLTFFEQLFDPAVIPQIYREYSAFKASYGSLGIIVSIVQNIYYIVESALVVLLVVLFQLAGESWTKKEKIPWGSIGLLLTWGLGHLTHGGLTTVWVCLFAAIVGVFYLLSKRHVIPSYIMVLLIFII